MSNRLVVGISLGISLTVAAAVVAASVACGDGTGGDGTVVGGEPSAFATTPRVAATDTPVEPTAPAAGQPYPDNPVFAGQDLTVVRTDAPPLISQADAMDAVSRPGVPWGQGGEWEGREVTVAATYGLVTAGRPGEGGRPWIGLRNLPLPDGTTLDHIEDRPMWVIDYGNTYFVGAGCPECTPPPDYNHSVYLIDAATASVWVVWGYLGE